MYIYSYIYIYIYIAYCIAFCIAYCIAYCIARCIAFGIAYCIAYWIAYCLLACSGLLAFAEAQPADFPRKHSSMQLPVWSRMYCPSDSPGMTWGLRRQNGRRSRAC